MVTKSKNAKKDRVKDGELKIKDKTLKDLSVKNMKQIRGGGFGTAAGFIPGGGVVAAASDSAKKTT